MKHIIFEDSETYSTAVLIKSTSFNKQELLNNYVNPLVSQGVAKNSIIAFTLKYEDSKAPVKLIKEYLVHLLSALKGIGVKYLLVADSAYFKTLTGQTKAEAHYGYALPCKIKGYEDFTVVLSVNYQALIYNPTLQSKLDLSITTLVSVINNTYVPMGTTIIHSASYPSSVESICKTISDLHQYPHLTCDIETFGLSIDKAKLGTISFAWDKHNGVAFPVDYCTYTPDSKAIRTALLGFFIDYKGNLTFHNAAFDVKVLIYELFMEHALDTGGLLFGLDVLTKRMDDTKIIAYLATNSTAGNVLGLKALAHEFAGNWAKEDIKDITQIPLNELLEYNLIDALCTHYVKEKYYPILVQDRQEYLYKTLMLSSLKLIIQIELTGMPLSAIKVQEVKLELETIQAKHLDEITNHPLVDQLTRLLQINEMVKANAKLKIKQHPIEHFSDYVFNPNSGHHLQKLFYEIMGLPVIDLTDTKQPATGADTIEKLINHCQMHHKPLMEALIGYGKVSKILSTFIPAFERAIIKEDGNSWLHGSFNLGGTVSGRLSSSDPNLQNIPAGSTYAKLIKQCFVAPKDWIFVGADFNSLEDYISALTTKDPNKLAVYEQGFDGHCLRAAYYFRDQCPHIDLTDPISVNSIKTTHPQLRQDSKGPTFLLTYGGTYHGMMSNLGWEEEKAKAIEKGYHDLYAVSDQYVQDRLQQASIDGYVEVAFGLRVRTPLLKQVVFGSGNMPYAAAAEGRTAGNALGQSYGLLNNRAAVEFMEKVWASKYVLDIKPVALIHDAIYLLVKDCVEVVEWVNRELIRSMQWQELPEIQHPVVKLGAALDVFYPDWSNKVTLPNNANQSEIRQLCQKIKEQT